MGRSDLRNNRKDEGFLCERKTRRGKRYLRAARKMPDDFWYFFAYYANLRGLTPSALLVHDDGYRAVFEDSTAERSAFWCDFHAFLGRMGRDYFEIPTGEIFWEARKTDQTKLLPGSIEDALLDVWQSALEAGMEISDWDLAIGPDDWGKTLTFNRPEGISKKYPETVSITPKPPRELDHLGVDGAREHINDIIAVEREITEVVRVKRPKSHAPRPRRERRVKGRHAGRKKLVKAADEAYEEFVEEHNAARIAFRDGNRDVVFPYGTVFWRRVVGVTVAPAPPPALAAA